ncbi:MAG: hypothetical protein WAO09_09380 [Candidatus Dormiibacterota bacterium]
MIHPGHFVTSRGAVHNRSGAASPPVYSTPVGEEARRVSVLARPGAPAAVWDSLRRLRQRAARRHRFGVERMVVVDCGDSRGQPQDDIARRLSHVTGWGVAELPVSEPSLGEVAQRIAALGGRPPALVVGPELLAMGSLELRTEGAILRQPWPILSVSHRRTRNWMPRILALWSGEGLVREMARAAWVAAQALDGLVYSVQVHEAGYAPGSTRVLPGPPLRFRSWSAPRHRILPAGPWQMAELHRLITVFSPDLILTDPRQLSQLARCGAEQAGSP